jgi:DNA replication protein DnaC
MASKCIHCKKDAVPVWDARSEKFKPLVSVCLDCFQTKEHHEWPFVYREVFEKNNWQFRPVHPSTPAAFYDTIEAKLAVQMQEAVKNYKPDQSYLLHGITGTGKTRTAWLMFNRGWNNAYPKNCEFLTMRKLEQKIEEGFEKRSHGEVIDRLVNCAVLALDDLGKERLTARMESDLFAIIDERTSNNRPTIITTNYNGNGLLDRFNNSETGAAIIRRIKDYFTIYGASKE